MITPFPWTHYSRKMIARIERPHSAGYYSLVDAKARALRLAVGDEGSLDDGSSLILYWLVDEENGAVVDCKHQTFGPTALIAAAEAACELCVGKNYDQASRLTADHIDKHLRDRGDQSAFPEATATFLNLAVSAIQEAAAQCKGLTLPEAYVAPPAPSDVQGEGYPGFAELSLQKKLAVIETVVQEDVLPYIELDGGGVEVLNLVNDREVIIAYKGACTTCFSSTGATLAYIQQVLRAKVYAELVVVPDL